MLRANRVSAYSHFEIYSGATPGQLAFWKDISARTKILPFDEPSAQAAVDINKALKLKRKQIGMADLFIAATAIANKLSLTTLNISHFNRIDGLVIVK